MQKFVFVFLGSGLGGIGRYALSSWLQSKTHSRFPYGTLTVNLIGCLAIGFLGGAFAGRWHVREETKLALITGILGGFTTFSAFGLETHTLFAAGHFLRGLLYIALSVGLGLAAVAVGYRAGHA